MEITLFSIVIFEFILITLLGIRIFSLSRFVKELFGKREGKDIDQVLEKYVKSVKKYFNDIEELKDFSHELYKMAEKSIQKIGFVRFNPFGDVGGDQSFCIALLNLKNSGIVITSMFGRDGTRIYSKQIVNSQSQYHLADEEKKAIEDAVANYKKGD